MKPWITALYTIGLTFSTAFMCLGYAALSDELLISGLVSSEGSEGIFITEANIISGANDGSSIDYYNGTTLESIVLLEDTTDTLQMEVTVLNNTPDTIEFEDVIYDALYYSNANIEINVIDIQYPNTSNTLSNGESVVVTLEFAYVDNLDSSIDSNVLESIINLDFSGKLNVAWDDSCVTSGVNSDAIESMNDGNSVIQDNTAYRWTNWGSSAGNENQDDSVLEIEWGYPVSLEEVSFYHFVDSNGNNSYGYCEFPLSITIELLNNNEYTTIANDNYYICENPTADVDDRTYAFDEDDDASQTKVNIVKNYTDYTRGSSGNYTNIPFWTIDDTTYSYVSGNNNLVAPKTSYFLVTPTTCVGIRLTIKPLPRLHIGFTEIEFNY